MALKTHSAFYYGHIIDENNNLINFKEGAGPEKTAEIPTGSYTLTKFVEVIVAALNAASSLEWSGSLNRTTGVITLTADGTASLLLLSGTNYLNTPDLLLGMNKVDRLNQTTFVGDFRSGYEYLPQFPLQDYLSKDRNKKLVNPVVSKSASGDTVSVQSFGIEHYIKFNIKWITNNPTDGLLRNDDSAVENVEQFLNYIVEKHPIEFMENETDRNIFDKVYLDSTEAESSGTGYNLKEYTDKDLPEFFESGLLSFRVINKE